MNVTLSRTTRSLLFVFVAMLVGSGPTRALETVERTVAVEQSAGRSEAIRVENLLGSVEIRGGAPAGKVQVKAHIVAEGKTAEAAQSLAESIHVLHSSNPKQALVHVAFPVDQHSSYRLPRGGALGWFSRWTAPVLKRGAATVRYDDQDVEIRADRRAVGLAVHLTVTLPYDVEASVYQAVGKIRGRGLRGVLRLETVEGEIESLQCFGRLEVESGGGAVHIGTFQGQRLEVKTVSSDLTLQSVRSVATRLETVSGAIQGENLEPGELTVRTESGGIKLNNVEPKTLDLSTVSGKVDLASRLRGTRQGTIESASGDVTLRVGMQSNFSLTPELKSGAVKAMGMKLDPDGVDEAPGRVRRGHGGPNLVVRAEDGDVTVRPYGVSRLDLMMGKTR